MTVLWGRSVREWYQDLLDRALEAPAGVDLRGLTGADTEQMEHDYWGDRPRYEAEVWLFRRTLTFRRRFRKTTVRQMWEVSLSVNYWTDPEGDPVHFIGSDEFFWDEADARARYELRREIFITGSRPLR